MRNSMASWPGIVLIDRTYNLLIHGFTLMLNLVEDFHGLSEVVVVCRIVNEGCEILQSDAARIKKTSYVSSHR